MKKVVRKEKLKPFSPVYIQVFLSPIVYIGAILSKARENESSREYIIKKSFNRYGALWNVHACYSQLVFASHSTMEARTKTRSQNGDSCSSHI